MPQRLNLNSPAGVYPQQQTPGAPIQRQQAPESKQSIDPTAILSQRHEAELRAIQDQWNQELSTIGRMEPVNGREKTFKAASEGQAKATQAMLELRQRHEAEQSNMKQIDTLFSQQPETAAKYKTRAVMGATMANELYPDQDSTDPAAAYDKLFLHRNKVESDLGDFRRAKTTRKVGVYGRRKTASGLISPLEIYDYNIEVKDKKGKITLGDWRLATQDEQQMQQVLNSELTTTEAQMKAVLNRQDTRSNLSRVARESQRMTAGTFGQKVQFSDKKLDPRPAAPKKQNIRRATNPKTGQTVISIDGGPWQ